jgi:hypothetical protein
MRSNYQRWASGQQVRAEGRQARGRRKVSKKHISRISLPNIVEEWAIVHLHDREPSFKAALENDEFDHTWMGPWLAPPPYPAAAVQAHDQLVPGHAMFTNLLTGALDGHLLWLELSAEAKMKMDFERVGKKPMTNVWRRELKDLLRREWPALDAFDVVFEQNSRERAVWQRHLVFLARRIYRTYYLKFL